MVRTAEVAPRTPQERHSIWAVTNGSASGLGGRVMTPGSARSRARASAHSVSAPRSMARICSTVMGSGTAPPERANTRNGSHLGHGVREDEDDELADVVVDAATFLHGGSERREVVVDEHRSGRLSGHVRAAGPHGDADVGLAQRRCVVDAVAGDGDDLALALEDAGDPELVLRSAPCAHHLEGCREGGAQVLVGHGVQLGAGDHVDPVLADAHLSGDLGGRLAAVA